MTDQYLRFINGVQALRRRTSALSVGLCGALGVAADPLPHQLSTVRRVLGDTHVRHLLSDEVGLGKTVQALMIINALRWQQPSHRTIVVAPDNLLSQWQEECWVRGHIMPALAGATDNSFDETAAVTLARPRDLMIRQGEGTRTISADSSLFDLLVLDEPQTMPRETIQMLSQASDNFRQALILSATPRLGDPAWRELIMRMIEPEASQLARLEGRTLVDVLEERENSAIELLGESADTQQWSRSFLRAAAGRKVIRNGRSQWSEFLPKRRNHEVRIQPIESERARYEIADRLLQEADPEQGLKGPLWTAARALQRSARAARTVLTDLSTQEGSLGERAERARTTSLEDPGDSRLDALLDILADQWSLAAERAFIVVCGDNPTIDMLRTTLPRYFPDLAGAISVMRRPATSELDGVANLREIQETLAPLLAGESRLLLVGDWVQAGLNLHHVAQGIIFFSLPWEIDSIDQLIGRIDRLGGSKSRRRAQNTVDIWRILIEGSQEAAIADVVASMGIFDAPMPPLSADELQHVQAQLGKAAKSRKVRGSIARLAGDGTGLTSRLTAQDPYTPERAVTAFSEWQAQTSPAPAMMQDIARSQDTPVRREERALGAWLQTIGKSDDFNVSSRRDTLDDYRFRTLWYYREAATGRAGASPFQLPATSRDNWMSDHIPFIYRRSDIGTPPRKAVFTDEGEETARPLRFLDHGSVVHDTLLRGYAKAVSSQFGPDKPVVQTSVILPEGHPARGIGSLAFLTVATLDPFPDQLVPGLWSSEARALLDQATTDAQRSALLEDRKALQALFHALQRRVRLEIPGRLIRAGVVRNSDGWKRLNAEDVDECLQPITASTDKAMARGRRPMSNFLKPEVASALRSKQLELVRSAAHQFAHDSIAQLFPVLEEFATQVSSQIEVEIRNRELRLKRRRNSQPEGVPIELWQGQISALERSLEMARVNGAEAIRLIQEFGAGRLKLPPPDPLSILVSLVSDQ
ncbi:SNF2-related protein [Roseovarius sp. 2305UL8-3]|uniref:SNF2-related protein n=1 Tax=Roseovarius conchicola TaxID=3121636 RepID=UPI0035273573